MAHAHREWISALLCLCLRLSLSLCLCLCLSLSLSLTHTHTHTHQCIQRPGGMLYLKPVWIHLTQGHASCKDMFKDKVIHRQGHRYAEVPIYSETYTQNTQCQPQERENTPMKQAKETSFKQGKVMCRPGLFNSFLSC